MTLDRQAFRDPRAIQLANTAAEVQELCRLVSVAPVPDQAALDELGNVAKGAARSFKELDAARRAQTDPLRLQKEQIDEWYRPALDAYKALKEAAGQRVARHVQETRAAAHAAQAAAGQAFAAGDQAAGHAAIAAIPAPAQTQGVSMREIVDFEITNPNMVDPMFCSPDPDKIAAEIKRQGGAGAVIPGVHVFTRMIPAVSTK